MNCPNCGAPITGDQCEYCRTVFRDRRADAIIIKQEVLIKSMMRCDCITPNEARAMYGFKPIRN